MTVKSQSRTCRVNDPRTFFPQRNFEAAKRNFAASHWLAKSFWAPTSDRLSGSMTCAHSGTTAGLVISVLVPSCMILRCLNHQLKRMLCFVCLCTFYVYVCPHFCHIPCTRVYANRVSYLGLPKLIILWWVGGRGSVRIDWDRAVVSDACIQWIWWFTTIGVQHRA